MRLIAAALSAGLITSGCLGQADSHSGVPVGNALEKPYGTQTKDSVPFRVGQEWDHTLLAIVNHSSVPITLIRVVPSQASGVGSIVHLISFQDSPLGSQGPSLMRTTVPEAVYHTLPPVFFQNGVCHVQRLTQLEGTTLAPRTETRVLTLMQALEPGSFSYQGYDVYYRENGRSYQQYLPIGYAATVSATAPPSPLQTWEAPACLSKTKVLPPLTG
ncbi:MAG: hypothetical protein QOI39_2732 [Mycobacterium sp.]|jgi:hypothetical protein|nr:hypothetical protein [Mycobacterium sp.]